MIAAGPASVAAPSAPNSHPDPMIDVSDAHRSPRNPTLRSRPSASRARDGASFAGVTTSAIGPSSGTRLRGRCYPFARYRSMPQNVDGVRPRPQARSDVHRSGGAQAAELVEISADAGTPLPAAHRHAGPQLHRTALRVIELGPDPLGTIDSAAGFEGSQSHRSGSFVVFDHGTSLG